MIFSLLCMLHQPKSLVSMHSLRSLHLIVMLSVSLFPWVFCQGQQLQLSQLPDSLNRWGNGAGLHSSVNPTSWMKSCAEDSIGQDSLCALKKPVISHDNTKGGEVETERGTLYEKGMATYYSAKTHGRLMANGTRYHKDEFFCAHKKLPFGTRIRVVNKKNGREVIVDVRDRGPFAKGRVIDLSNRAAAELGMLHDGVVPVELWVLP